jgi:hypothetical protein
MLTCETMNGVFITTIYMPATNTKGSRIKAILGSDKKVSITIAYDYSFSREYLHTESAIKLADKLGWDGTLVGGWHGEDMVFLFKSKPTSTDIF